MSPFPTHQQIEQLHRRHAPDEAAYDLIFTHCQIVWEIAQSIITEKQLVVDIELVRAGCFLHDIGTYALYQDNGFNEGSYITHGILGYELLQNEGYGEALCRIASHHTGVGLSKEDIQHQGLPLPHEDFLAESLEEKLVMYADKFHSKHPRFNSFEGYRDTLAQFGAEKVAYFAELAEVFGVPDVASLAQQYNQAVR